MTIADESTDKRNSARHAMDYVSKLSYSASTILKIIQQLEEDPDSNSFYPSQELGELRKAVSTYRGGFYNAVVKKLVRIISKGGVEIITSNDLMAIIRHLWKHNISRLSKTELMVLEGALRFPELRLNELAKRIGISYSKTRRGFEQLRNSDVVERIGVPDLVQMGLDRILIIMDSCQAVPTSPYLTQILFSDKIANKVFIKGLIPSRNRNAFLSTAKSLRSLSESTSVWALSNGEPHLSSTYYDTDTKLFEFDPLHFKLLLRAGSVDLTVGSFSMDHIQFPKRFDLLDIKVIESLLTDYDSTVRDLVKRIDMSEGTVFRRRSKIIRDGIVKPRIRISIPALSDIVLGIFSIDSASKAINAWRRLPLSYVSQLMNLENPSDKRILFTAALPRGGSDDLVNVLSQEMSKVDEYEICKIDAGISEAFPVSALYDVLDRRWSFSSSFFDIRSYSSCRIEGDSARITLDLA